MQARPLSPKQKKKISFLFTVSFARKFQNHLLVLFNNKITIFHVSDFRKHLYKIVHLSKFNKIIDTDSFLMLYINYIIEFFENFSLSILNFHLWKTTAVYED